MRLGVRTVGVAVLALVAVIFLAIASTMASAVTFAATVALIMGGTGNPTPDPVYVDAVDSKYIQPAYPGYAPTPQFTPEQFWPVTGLTAMTFNKAVAQGVGLLDSAIKSYTIDPVTGLAKDNQLVVFGYSQSARIVTDEERGIDGSPLPTGDQLSFIVIGNPNRPNGGILERFAGLYIPILGVTFDGATPTTTAYQTTDYSRQYDGWSDWPNNPLNLLSDVNAVLGILYLHGDYLSSSLPAPVLQDQYGNTTYYLYPAKTLPLLIPVQQIPVVGPILADMLDPTVRVWVEAGYDRKISPGVPTRANFLYIPNPIAFVRNLLVSIPTGLDNGFQDLGLGRPFKTAIPGPYGVGGPPVTLPGNTVTTPSAPAQTGVARTPLHAVSVTNVQLDPAPPAPDVVGTATSAGDDHLGTGADIRNIHTPTTPKPMTPAKSARPKIRGPIGPDQPRVGSIQRTFGGPSTSTSRTTEPQHGTAGEAGASSEGRAAA
jgi:hypothetical protein